MTTIKDRMTYIAICNSKSGSFMRERNVSEMDRKTTVEDIASGQIEDVVQVLECNPVEGTCRDVTEDVMREAAFMILDASDYEDLSDWERDFVDSNAHGALISHRTECREEAAHRRSLQPGCAGWGM